MATHEARLAPAAPSQQHLTLSCLLNFAEVVPKEFSSGPLCASPRGLFETSLLLSCPNRHGAAHVEM
eukprot:891092-Pleurochrysis_carterae.AAC.2